MGSCQSKNPSDAVMAAGVAEKDHTNHTADDNLSTEGCQDTTAQPSTSYESSIKLDEVDRGSKDSGSILQMDDNESSAFPFPIFSESIDNNSEYYNTTREGTFSKDESTMYTYDSSKADQTKTFSKDVTVLSKDDKDRSQSMDGYNVAYESSQSERSAKYICSISDEPSEDTSLENVDNPTREFNEAKFQALRDDTDVFKHMFCVGQIIETVLNCGSTNDVQENDDFAKNDEDVVEKSAVDHLQARNLDTATQGVHYSVIKDVLENHLPAYESLDVATATTGDVIAEVVKKHPKLSEMKVSWIEMLQQENALGGNGVALAGPATAMISHTWRYSFQAVAKSIIHYAEEYEKKSGHPFYIWMDMFILNQFATESFNPDWLKQTFTNVIKDIGLTVSIMSPFEDPASIKRVWCLWEVYLSTRYAQLEIAFPPDQKKRFEEALLSDPYSITTMLEKIDQIDAENAEAFDPKDKEMIFDAIRSSIGFEKLNTTVIGALREWIETQCQEKVRAIKDGSLDAVEALAAPTQHSGSGSTLFRAITLKSTGLAQLSLLHPDVAKVINGTSDSWPPFANALTSGLCDIADAIIEHPGYDFSYVPWQMDSYMVIEKDDHRYHPDFDTSVSQSRVVQTLRKFFTMRAAAGYSEPSYEEYVDMSVKGSLPKEWTY